MLEIAAGMATYAYGESNVAVSCATNFVAPYARSASP